MSQESENIITASPGKQAAPGDVILRVDHVGKEYRLGTIGGGTLRADLQSWWARVRRREDPNCEIGAYNQAVDGRSRLVALDDVSFEVRAGEVVGIIGHNGAGKSTLLKLISRVTAPTTGQIRYRGRIASMLEVGTGFHPELTGRENVYMNGAILGMTRSEIDAKFDEIVEFAEMWQFIDTPVKRYSSGMHVKLAFAVAAHLDSEIMIMDEVLAVGDAKFQQKCLGHMGDIAQRTGRTVLYVSHNMATVRQLCTRCLVLDHGRLVFDGDPDAAIEMYLEMIHRFEQVRDVADVPRRNYYGDLLKIKRVEVLDTQDGVILDDIRFRLEFDCRKDVKNVYLRAEVCSDEGYTVGTAPSPVLFPQLKAGGSYRAQFHLRVPELMPGKFSVFLVLYRENEFGTTQTLDRVEGAFTFEISDDKVTHWVAKSRGFIRFPDVELDSFTTV
ncbi:MAG: ABC transporter ATP-binding protein [Clostridia bacterium]|nr:ABC transporter ATP-binding protein [Clostridia bacterium]